MRLGVIIAWVMGALLLLPLFSLGLSFCSPLTERQHNIWIHIKAYLLPTAVKDTLILTLGSGIGALFFGVSSAWVLTRKNLALKSLIGVLLICPLAIPPYLYAYLLTDLKEGMTPLLIFIRDEFGSEIYHIAEKGSRYIILILLFSTTLSPYIFLAARSAFSGSLKSLNEISLSLGHSPLKTFWKIDLPLIRPALIAGLFLVVMEVLNDYGAVKHFGFSTFTVTVFRAWFSYGEIEIAQKIAGWILIGIFGILTFEQWQRGRHSYHTKKEKHQRSTSLPAATSRDYLICLLPITLGLLIPLGLMISWISCSYHTLNTDFFPSLGKALINSLLLGAGVGVTTIILALFIHGIKRFSSSYSLARYSKFLNIAGYSSPGAVMAVGVLGCMNTAYDSGLTITLPFLIGGSVIWLAYGLTSRYYSVAGQMISQSLERLPRQYDEAFLSLSTTPVKGFFKVIIPLISPAIWGGIALVFIDICKELPLCLILRSFNFETLGTFAYGIVDQGQIYHSAFPALCLILLCLTAILLIELGGWRQK